MKITIIRAEGPSDQCGERNECATFADANMLLRRWSNTAPEKGGYDKCDFKIEDESIDLNYDGRYDLKHWRCESPDLKRHVLDFLLFVGGQNKPRHMTEAQYAVLLTDTYKFTPVFMNNALKVHNYLKEQP